MMGAAETQNGTVLVLAEDWEMGTHISRSMATMGLTPIIASTRDGISRVASATDIIGAILVSERLDPGQISFCREARQVFPGAFVIAFAHILEEQEELRALLAGVDQCFHDPMREEIFQAHVRSLIDRFAMLHEPVTLGGDVRVLGAFELDLSHHRVTVLGKSVTMTPTEMRVIEFLSRTPGRTVARSVLGYAIWGWDGDVYHEHIKCHVSNIRRKLRRICPWNVIETVRGVGYCFALPTNPTPP